MPQKILNFNLYNVLQTNLCPTGMNTSGFLSFRIIFLVDFFAFLNQLF